jgi:hypothetical protein
MTRTRDWVRRHLIRPLFWGSGPFVLAILQPLNWLLSRCFRNRRRTGSVLHISEPVHIASYTVDLLRAHGIDAAYAAIGTNTHWTHYDFRLHPSGVPAIRVLQEFIFVWRIVAQFETIHCHFGITGTANGWELPYLKSMGRRIIYHFRGCEARDRTVNMARHPEMNICQDCDYSPTICESSTSKLRRRLASQYADHVLVTTPDMRDFLPEAEHFPFFAPMTAIPVGSRGRKRWPDRPVLKIVHATNHPGIEGTARIRAIVERLIAKGRPVELLVLSSLSHQQVMDELADADLSIGKMKMGYYANAQIEAMCLGVPTITYVRDDLLTEDLAASGLIFSHLDDLEATIEHFMDHPEALASVATQAKENICRIHDNAVLVERLKALYRSS